MAFVRVVMLYILVNRFKYLDKISSEKYHILEN